MRGDAAEEALLEGAAALVTQHGIDSDDQLGPLFQLPENADPEVIRRLRQMFEAGGWVLFESAIADLPADLRWLFESGAVTLEQLTAIYRSRGATSVADLAAAVAEGALVGALLLRSGAPKCRRRGLDARGSARTRTAA